MKIKITALLVIAVMLLTSCAETASTATKTTAATSTATGAPTAEPTADAKFPVIDDGSFCVYVATDGDDNAAGTADAPFATLAKAKEFIKTVDKSKYNGISVVFANGTWNVTEMTSFDASDAGTAECPIRYIGNGETVFTGGISFDFSKFEKIDDEFASYLTDDAKTKVVKLDLKQFGFAAEDYARMLLRSPDRTDEKFGDLPVFSLYANDKRMDLSRYPNDSFITIQSVEEKADGNFDFYYKDFNKYKEHIKSWHTTEDIYLAGSFQNFYYQDYAETVSVSQRTSKIVINPFFCEKKPIAYNAGHVFYFTNIAEEVDLPGEYYLSPECVLYYYPIDGAENATFKYSTYEGMYMFDLEGADHITFDNIIFENTSKNVFEINSSYITIKNCTFRDIGKDAIHKVTGTDFTLDSNKFTAIGELVVEVSSYVSNSLTPSNIVITNNYINSVQETGRRSAMALYGTGMYVAHNEFYNCPRCCLDFGGPNGVYEYNIFDHCNYECDDYGVMYQISYMSWGTEIRYNYFNDINSTIRASSGDDWGSWCGVHAIYFDGHGSGCSVYGNVFEDCESQAIVNNGGRNLYEHDNVFIGCQRTIQYAGLFDEAQYASLDMGWYIAGEWGTAFPDLAAVNFEKDLEKISSEDKTHCYMPGGSVIKDNWSYIPEGADADDNFFAHELAWYASDITLPEIFTYAEGAEPDWKEAAAKHIPDFDLSKIGNIK